jgi:hypothetical protein
MPMISLVHSLGLSAFVIESLLVVGLALSLAFRAGVRGMAFVGTSIAFGVVAHALAGFLVGLCGDSKAVAAIVLLSAMQAASLVLLVRIGCGRLAVDPDLLHSLAVAVAAWFTLTAVATVATRVAEKPAEYYDGPYVYKTDVLSTRIQSLVGNLPCDNALPHVVTEFLLRDIPFAVERPIMPGQEVTNRPFLMAFAVLPFRAALDAPPPVRGRLGRFHYVGSEWPDVTPLLADDAYSQFLAVAIPLNASLVVGMLWVLSLASPSLVVTALSIAVFTTSYFLLSQTLFAWPKSLCGFWTVAAMMSLVKPGSQRPFAAVQPREAAVAGACLGVAYWSHPLALVFAVSLLLVQGVAVLLYRTRAAVENLLVTAVCFAAVIAPWIVWSRLIVCIPSDLLAQNLHASQPVARAIAVRAANMYHVLVPACFDVFPPGYRSFIKTWWLSLPVAIGLVPLAVVALQPGAVARWVGGRGWAFAWAFFILPWILICCSFGRPAASCILHGFQFHAAAGLSLVVAELSRRGGRGWRGLLLAALCLQVVANVAYVVAKVRQDVPGMFDATIAFDKDLLLDSTLRIEKAPLPPNLRATVSVAGTIRQGLWFNAPGVASVGPVDAGRATEASAWVAIHEHVWPIIPPRGVDFRLKVLQGERAIAEAAVNLSPAVREGDRGWVPIVVRLPSTGADGVVFQMDVGEEATAGNIDWCLWADLRLQVPRRAAAAE